MRNYKPEHRGRYNEVSSKGKDEYNLAEKAKNHINKIVKKNNKAENSHPL